MQEQYMIENLNFLVDLAMVSNDTRPTLKYLQMFNKAWNLPNEDSCKKWQGTIHKETADMNKQQVWQKMLKRLMPPNCRCIKDKWVFKIKQNSVYQAHLVACGYSQVPSVDLSENYSLVVNDITFCILLLMVIHFSYLAKIVDLETVFLY